MVLPNSVDSTDQSVKFKGQCNNDAMASSGPSHPGRDGRKRSARGDSRRTELIDAAATLFANKGYRDTSIGEVAARVGVSQQSLLYYFGSKAGLLHAVINQRDDASMQFVRQIAASGSSVSLEQLPDYARRNVERPDLARLFAVLVADNLHPDDEAHDHFVQRYRNLREVIETIIIGGQRSGDFSPDVDPGLKAIQIVAFIEGANLQWLLDPKSIDLVRASEDFAADFIRALTRQP
jgi:AcrR family transcriptional regulator